MLEIPFEFSPILCLDTDLPHRREYYVAKYTWLLAARQANFLVTTELMPFLLFENESIP
jgi:hypothetical protein